MKKIIILVMFLLLVGSVSAAITKYPGVKHVPTFSNITYEVQSAIDFASFNITRKSVGGNNVSANLTGNATVKMIAWGSSNVNLNVSGGKVAFDFDGVQSGLVFKYGSGVTPVEYATRNFIISLGVFQRLYTGSAADSGGGGGGVTQFASQTGGMTKEACEEDGGIYVNNNCYRQSDCNGKLLVREDGVFCQQCSEGFIWNGEVCLLDAEKFDLLEWFKGNPTVLLIGVIVLAGLIFAQVIKVGKNKKAE